jgi:hypothetical protein
MDLVLNPSNSEKPETKFREYEYCFTVTMFSTRVRRPVLKCFTTRTRSCSLLLVDGNGVNSRRFVVIISAKCHCHLMSQPPQDLTLPLLLVSLVSAASVVAVLDSDDEDDDEVPNIAATVIAEALPLFRRNKRRAEAANNGQATKKWRKFDYEGAMNNIQRDYLGPDPFFGHYFERVFRVSRGIVERLLQVAGASSSFFVLQRNKVTGELGIRPEAKVLIALKQLAFGSSTIAYIDYFQMSDTTGRKCFKDLCKIIATSELREEYLGSPTKSDARRLSRMHEVEYGVPGCIGSLYCRHVRWRTCPRAWHGQYEGKEGTATIAIEAVADHTTRIWHTAFGFPGTLNDINIWDQSPLLRSFIDGSFQRDIDFDYVINGKSFGQLWLMVDGIYPELSRFVKNVSVPITEEHRYYSKWQEACRKCVERAFGILKRKFMILSNPIELFFESDIRYVVEACIILHNMMVEIRVQRDEEEHGDNYQLLPEAHLNAEEVHLNGDEDAATLGSNSTAPLLTTRERLERLKERWPHNMPDEEARNEMHEAIADHFRGLKDQWDKLYDRKKHFELRDAVVAVVNSQRVK